jgi:hypothetical protein
MRFTRVVRGHTKPMDVAIRFLLLFMACTERDRNMHKSK